MNYHKATECDCAECVAYRAYFESIGWDMLKMDYRRPGLPAQEETSPKPADKTKKNYKLERTSGYWQLWENLKTRERKWLTEREASGANGKTFAEAWFDADMRFKPENV